MNAGFMKAYDFSLDDIIETPGHTAPRLYSIIGIHLGALNQEDVLELVTIDRTAPNGMRRGETRMFVPKEMVEAGLSAGVFTLTKLE